MVNKPKKGNISCIYNAVSFKPPAEHASCDNVLNLYFLHIPIGSPPYGTQHYQVLFCFVNVVVAPEELNWVKDNSSMATISIQ